MHETLWWQPIYRLRFLESIRRFSIDHGDGSENVTFKMIFAFLQTLSRLFRFAENVKCRQIFQEFISWGPYSNSEGERKIRRRLFTSPTKRAIRHFHVVVVQWQQRNVQKKQFSLPSPSSTSLLKLPYRKDSNEKSGRLLCSLQVNYVFFLSGPECNSYV